MKSLPLVILCLIVAPLSASGQTLTIDDDATLTLGAPAEVGRLAVAGALVAEAALIIHEHLGLTGSVTIEESGAVRLASAPDGEGVVTIATFQNDGGTLSGNLTYERYYQGTRGWRLISTPFADVPFTSLSPSFHTQGATGATHPGGGAILYGYDPEAAEGARWQAVTDYGATAEPGRGYLFFFYMNNISDAGAPHLPGRWIIQGQESSGPLAATLPYDGGEYPELNHANFSLLGNPFAAPLDWHAIVDGATGTVGSTYYAWDPAFGAQGNYRTYQPGVAESDAGRYIAPFQGFFVFSPARAPR